MNTTLVIVEFLPLVIYILVDMWKGFRAGIVAAMLCTLVMIGYDLVVFHELHKFVLGEGIMILIAGSISLKMNNDRYFKFQPTVLAFIFAGMFAWFQVFDKPLMLHFIPHMEKLLSTQDTGSFHAKDVLIENQKETENAFLKELHSKHYQRVLSRLSGHFIWLFLAHGLIMGYAALHGTTRSWFAWRMAIYPFAFALVVINQLLA